MSPGNLRNSRVGVAEVVPHDVYLAVLGEELAGLAVEVGLVAREVAGLVELVAVRVVAQGMQVVNEKIGVMPVYQ